MNRTERFLTIIFGIIISVIVGIVAQMIFPFPFGIGVAMIIPIIVIYVMRKKSKLDSQSQNDDIQKLKDRVEELEKDKK